MKNQLEENFRISRGAEGDCGSAAAPQILRMERSGE